MKNIGKVFLRFAFFVAALVSSLAATAQDMVLVSADGSQTKAELSEIRSFTTMKKDGLLAANYKSGGSEKGLRKVVFNGELDEEAAAGLIESEAIAVYPNPVRDMLYISGAGDEPDVEILRAKGETVLKTKGAEVNVSALGQDVYLVRVGNKFVRIVKR